MISTHVYNDLFYGQNNILVYTLSYIPFLICPDFIDNMLPCLLMLILSLNYVFLLCILLIYQSQINEYQIVNVFLKMFYLAK